MAFNPSPKVAAARDFGRKFKAKQVIILFVTEDNKFGYASYGKTKNLCHETRRLADAAYEAVSEAIMHDNSDDEWDEYIGRED